MPLQTYRLPDLLSLVDKPPIGYLNPHLKGVDSEFNEWVKKTFSASFQSVIYKSQIPYLIASMSPHASYLELKMYTHYILCTLILDVLSDNRSSAESRLITQAFMQAVRGSEDTSRFDHPLIQAVRHIVPPIKAAMDPFYWPQLLTVTEEYATNVVHEALDREGYNNKSSVRDIPEYLAMRGSSAGLYICFTLTRAFQDIRVPDDVLAHPAIRGMEDTSAQMSVLTNDIYSYKKECGSDEILNNIQTVLNRHPRTAHLNLQERFDHSGKLWAEMLDRFHEHRSKLPSFGAEMDRRVALYAEVLLENAVGNVEWSLVTTRYRVFDNESDRRDNILRLNLEGVGSKPRRLLQQIVLLSVVAILTASFGYFFIRGHERFL